MFPMPEFVCCKAEQIAEDWEKLFTDDCAHWNGLFDLFNSKLEEYSEYPADVFEEFQSRWVATAAENSLEMAANFKRRFLRRTRCFPHLILWLSRRLARAPLR